MSMRFKHSNKPIQLLSIKMATKNTRQSKELLISNLSRTTRLSRDDVINVMNRFNSACTKEEGKLQRNEFREELTICFDITDDILMDRVFRAFDLKSGGALRLEDYVTGIGTFLNGSLDDHVRLCFHVYDVNNDGYISRDDMYQLLKSCLVKAPTEEDPDEMVKELIEIVMKKLDIDHDGRVSMQDFKLAVQEDKLMMESLGKCLPDKKHCDAFLEKTRKSEGSESSPSNTINISQQKELNRQKENRVSKQSFENH